MNLEEKVKCLNTIAQNFYAGAQSCGIMELKFTQRGLGKFAEILKGESDDGLARGKKIDNRILELGGKVEFGTIESPIFDDPKEYLDWWKKALEEGLVTYNKIDNELTDDYATRTLIEDLMADAESDLNMIKKHLCIIETIGYENYLIEMSEI